MGTTYSSSSNTFDQWQATANDNFAGTDMTTTWFTTNDATFELTGVQVEVGSQATEFEHRSVGDELLLCQRYFFKSDSSSTYHACGYGSSPGSNSLIQLPQTVEMRTAPTFTHGSITNGSDQGSNHSTQQSYLYLSNSATNSARISEYTLDAEL